MTSDARPAIGLVTWTAEDVAAWATSPLLEGRDDAEPRAYNGGAYVVATVRGPVIETAPFHEAIVSWAVDTPRGTWIEARLRARTGTAWTKWFVMGVWAATTETIERHSVLGQADADGDVDTDVLRLVEAGQALQVELALFGERAEVLPIVRRLAVSTAPGRGVEPAARSGDRALWGRLLDVPPRSQMVHPDGGEVWCSPTATSMVLAHFGTDVPVPSATADTWDFSYKGAGNWSFNVAYAARFGYVAYVTRFGALREAERWIAAGVPVVFSFAWRAGEIAGAAVEHSAGHLAVLVGFDREGRPIVNDPAAPDEASVRRTYDRHELEHAWLRSSGGTVYLIYPPTLSTPS